MTSSVCVVRLAAGTHRGPNFVTCVEENDIAQAGWGEILDRQVLMTNNKNYYSVFKFQAELQSSQIGAYLFLPPPFFFNEEIKSLIHKAFV